MNATLKQLVGQTRDYLLSSARHLKKLPEIRSFGDAVQFATDAKNRGMTYAKKTVAVLQKGAAQYKAQCGDWVKTKKGEWVKMGSKAPLGAKKKAATKQTRRANVMRAAPKKMEEQERQIGA